VRGCDVLINAKPKKKKAERKSGAFFASFRGQKQSLTPLRPGKSEKSENELIQQQGT